jgi:hypothetical protein
MKTLVAWLILGFFDYRSPAYNEFRRLAKNAIGGQ